MTTDMVLGLLERLEQLFEELPGVPVSFSLEHQNTHWISALEVPENHIGRSNIFSRIDLSEVFRVQVSSISQ